MSRKESAPKKKGKKDNAAPGQPEKLGRKEYERELERLHVELVRLQQWVVHKGLRVCVVFEGRDGAGKGGTIKAITERVSPRVFRVVALPAPTEREKSQMYMQRYVRHFPAAGEIDRAEASAVLSDARYAQDAGLCVPAAENPVPGRPVSISALPL